MKLTKKNFKQWLPLFEKQVGKRLGFSVRKDKLYPDFEAVEWYEGMTPIEAAVEEAQGWARACA